MSKSATAQAREWYGHFRRAVQRTGRADALREAALAGRLGRWTQELTDAVVEGGVFCYRRRPEEIGGLIAELTRGVMADVGQSQDRGCELLLVVGTRSKAEGFPDGFFKPYEWEPVARRFRALR